MGDLGHEAEAADVEQERGAHAEDELALGGADDEGRDDRDAGVVLADEAEAEAGEQEVLAGDLAGAEAVADRGEQRGLVAAAMEAGAGEQEGVEGEVGGVAALAGEPRAEAEAEPEAERDAPPGEAVVGPARGQRARGRPAQPLRRRPGAAPRTCGDTITPGRGRRRPSPAQRAGSWAAGVGLDLGRRTDGRRSAASQRRRYLAISRRSIGGNSMSLPDSAQAALAMS